MGRASGSVSTHEESYGPLDRLLHRIAFRAGFAQRALADVEEALFRERLEATESGDPVLVTALPRSGTSILLRLLVESGRFASHLYRDMPFVLCPLLWARFTDRFATEEPSRERDHGDGLRVSASTPEAFEEMIWKEFWPDHYEEDRIRPWTAGERRGDFERFLAAHMRKIVSLRSDDPGEGRRYVSKNNLNIARLAAPPQPFRDGVFLVPFREPLQQAASMLRQHERFTAIHRESDFTREYMEAIGHHEFGVTLKPVDFGGWLAEAPPPDGLEFWVRYWVAAYEHVLEHAGDRVCLVSYARLTERPEPALSELEGVLGLPGGALSALAGRLHPPREHEVEAALVPGAVRERAAELHEELEAAARV